MSPVSSRSSSSSSSASATQTALSASGNTTQSKGLSSGATIAIAVIIPIVAVAAAIIFGLLFWRRRRNRKNAEEKRKNEMAEYGYNPNNDPTLPVGVAYTDGGSEGNDDSGYRGWGATTVSNRKTSTTLGSNSRAAAVAGVNGAMSDGGSQAGGYSHPSPSAGAGSDGTQEPLMQAHHDNGAAAVAGGAVGGTAVGALASNSARNQRLSNSIHRGPSNASSAYSAGGAHSEISSEHIPTMPGPYQHEEVPYNVYNEMNFGQNPYGDAYSQQGDQPVIRDVQARRNTRIERAPTFPQQGGIAQNF